MQCNIDAKGKLARLIWGIILLVLAAGLAGLILLEVVTGGWGWVGVVGMSLLGGFAVFEARAGWCVARAIGFKTPY